MSERQPSTETEEELRRLLASAGPRESIPAPDRLTIEAAAHREWQRVVQSPSAKSTTRPMAWRLAIAASLGLAVAAAWWWRAGSPAGPVETQAAATVERFAGTVRRIGGTHEGAAVRSAGEAFFGGDEIEVTSSPSVPGGFLAVRLAGGASVRFDHATRVRFASVSTLELRRDALYVDSGARDGKAGHSVEVRTRFGTVQELGTQFEVRVEDSAEAWVRVRVREGSVLLQQGDAEQAAQAGEELTAHSANQAQRRPVERSGETWAWVLAAAPTLDIESIELRSYLAWLTRETGWRVRYADAELERTANSIRLHGTIEGLRPDESVAVVLPGCGLDHRLAGDTLLLTRRQSL